MKKTHGGKRPNTGPKGRLQANPETRQEWLKQLTRAITAASTNFGVIKKNTFWNQREIRSRWGNKAIIEFKNWFESRRHYNAEVADGLLQEFVSGKIDEKKYKKLLGTQAYTWVWSIKSDQQKSAWQLTRGLVELK